MPRYLALTDLLISHESRVVKAGTEFETVFPKVKTADGEVEMRLGESLRLIEPEAEATAKPAKGKAKADGADLV